MWRRCIGRLGCGAAALALGAGAAQAAGFALKEQSAKAQGNAFAGATAGAEDVSYMFFNPAALGWRRDHEVDGVLTYVAPRSKLQNAEGSTVLRNPVDGSVLRGPIGGRGSKDDVGEDALLPSFYAAVPLPVGLRFGLGVNVPFGLATDYPDGWVGRYHGVDSHLRTVNINPALAWRATDWLSLGAGFQAQYADGELTNAIDFGTIGAALQVPGAVPGGQDGFARLDGDDWAYGWNAGVLVEPVTGTRLGVSYRSEIDHEIDGDVDFSGDDAGIATFVRGATGRFVDSDATLDVTTPASLSFGVQQDITPRLAVMAEAQWTGWSSFDQLTVKFDNPAEDDNVTEEEWEDSWFFALGSTYRATDAVTLRAGVAYDQSPIKDKFRTPRIPDEDRYWLSVGAGWQPATWLELDGTFTYIQVKDSEVDLAATDEGSQFRGDLEAEYDNMILLFGLSASLRF